MAFLDPEAENEIDTGDCLSLETAQKILPEAKICPLKNDGEPIVYGGFAHDGAYLTNQSLAGLCAAIFRYLINDISFLRQVNSHLINSEIDQIDY